VAQGFSKSSGKHLLTVACFAGHTQRFKSNSVNFLSETAETNNCSLCDIMSLDTNYFVKHNDNITE